MSVLADFAPSGGGPSFGLSGRSALTPQVAAAGWTPDIDEYRRKTSAWVADIDPERPYPAS